MFTPLKFRASLPIREHREEKMSEITERVAKAHTAVAEANEALAAFWPEMTARRTAEFLDVGGCRRCNGRGWVVVWDTLDCMDGSCHQSRGCPESGIHPEGHGAGAPFNHGFASKYDKFHHGNPRIERARTDGEKAILATLTAIRDAALAESRAAGYDAEPTRGREVKVVRGRKVPKGTTGRVFWTGNKGWGDRVGIECANGERVFVNPEYVEVLA